jgi:predicted transcriptional regulator
MRAPSGNIGRLLGEAERRVMEVMWRRREAMTVRDVADSLQPGRPLAYTTVMTIMQRLTEKGVLVRTGAQQSYVYRSRYSPEEFYRTMAGKVLHRIRKEFGDVAIACFLEEAEKVDRRKLKELIRTLRQRRSAS